MDVPFDVLAPEEKPIDFRVATDGDSVMNCVQGTHTPGAGKYNAHHQSSDSGGGPISLTFGSHQGCIQPALQCTIPNHADSSNSNYPFASPAEPPDRNEMYVSNILNRSLDFDGQSTLVVVRSRGECDHKIE
jgi:hypothetical protein